MSVKSETFTPKIAAFLCLKWGYGAADMAGTIRSQYPPSVRTIRVRCLGVVHPDFILRALYKGADGVLLIGWRLGECDFESGNIVATKQVQYLKQLLRSIGLSEERLQIYYCSSAEGMLFADIVRDVTEKLSKLGPNPIREVKS